MEEKEMGDQEQIQYDPFWMIADDFKEALEHLEMLVDGIDGEPDKHQQQAIEFLKRARVVYCRDFFPREVALIGKRPPTDEEREYASSLEPMARELLGNKTNEL